MRVISLSHRECLGLVPHWPEVDIQKFSSCFSADLRSDPHTGISLLAVPPIMIDSERYILNGQHRSIAAGLRGLGLIAYSFDNLEELKSFPPEKTIPELEKTRAIMAYETKFLCQLECVQEEVYFVHDLCERVKLHLMQNT
jgi:hypothetical protein